MLVTVFSVWLAVTGTRQLRLPWYNSESCINEPVYDITKKQRGQDSGQGHDVHVKM